MSDPRVEQTLDALVEEAYRIAITRGVAISKPDGWKRWKRAVYADTARREGPGYLRHHYQRLGLAPKRADAPACHACGDAIYGSPVEKDDDPNAYCSYRCAGIPTMSLDEYLNTLDPDARRNFEQILRRREGAA